MISPASALQEAARLHPERAVRLAGEGQFTVAVLAGDDLVLRFPRHEVAVAPLLLEVRLLERIRSLLSSVDVPEVLEVRLELPIGRAHLTHRFLPGSIVRRTDVAGWPGERVQHVGTQVGRFLRELQALTADGLAVGAPVRTARAFAQALAGDVERLLAPRMDADVRKRVQGEIEALACLPDQPSVLCHTDLGGNLLFDATTGRIGVIDFGDCVVTHPAFEVASLGVLGADLVDATVAAAPELRPVLASAPVVRATFAVQDACNAARQGDWAYVDEVLRAC